MFEVKSPMPEFEGPTESLDGNWRSGRMNPQLFQFQPTVKISVITKC